MRTRKGNIWNREFDGYWRCITTNGVVKANGELVMGAGIAKQAAQRYPNLPEILGLWVKNLGNHPFFFETIQIISFPTKHHWRDKSDIKLIKESALNIVDRMEHFEVDKVALPKPGCANGGLEWGEVEPVLSSILDDRFLVVDLNF